jgi:hypothetical protein
MSNEPRIEWTSLPIRDYPGTFLALAGFFAVFSYGLWQLCIETWKMPGLFYLGLLIIFLDLLPFYIPTRYRFYESEVQVTYFIMSARRKYSDFRCWYADRKGVMLGTFARPSRLDRFRGQSVRFSKAREEQPDLFLLLEEKIGKRC